MAPLSITITVEVDPDEFGVVDGRDFVRDLLTEVLPFLTPYVRGCPDCAATLASAIAKEAAWNFDGSTTQRAVTIWSCLETAEHAFRTHLDQSDETTRDLLGYDDCPHDEDEPAEGD